MITIKCGNDLLKVPINYDIKNYKITAFIKIDDSIDHKDVSIFFHDGEDVY